MSVYFPFTVALFTIMCIRGGRVLLALLALQMDASPMVVGLLAGAFSVPARRYPGAASSVRTASRRHVQRT